ncbi:MAG: rod shape-determining protein MreC [Parasporobacterium sp.]|nr:rod shape-determining protein MreC [Parasporobacterium sp.]
MPEKKKKTTSKINIDHRIASDTLRNNIVRNADSKMVGYIKRTAKRKAEEHIASERFSEYADRSKNRKKLKDADAPLTIQEKSINSVRKIISYVKVHKAPRDERSVRHVNPKVILGILCALCLALILLSAVSDKVRAPFRYVASVVAVPAQKGINSIGLWISDLIQQGKTIEELEMENAELRSQVDDLTLQLLKGENDRNELYRLREQMGLSDKYGDYEMTAAHIIAKNPGKWFNTFTIDKGTRDGICKDMNVVASGGLVGIITDSGPDYSTVRSIIDDESSVSAKFRDTSELCMVNGSLTLMEDNLLEFTDVSAEVEISPSGAVVTSHVSSKYLPDILIGYVADFKKDGNDLTQSGHIYPVVDFTNLEEVMIITTLKETSD